MISKKTDEQIYGFTLLIKDKQDKLAKDLEAITSPILRFIAYRYWYILAVWVFEESEKFLQLPELQMVGDGDVMEFTWTKDEHTLYCEIHENNFFMFTYVNSLTKQVKITRVGNDLPMKSYFPQQLLLFVD